MYKLAHSDDYALNWLTNYVELTCIGEIDLELTVPETVKQRHMRTIRLKKKLFRETKMYPLAG